MSDPGRASSAVRFDDAVRVRLGEDRGFLFDQRSGRVYSLNATAAFAAGRLQGAEPLPAVAAAVAAAFDVDAATAARDLARFVADLAGEGLVMTDG